jgi:two-component system LytT family response regulator
MLKCIIADDESGAVEILARYVRKTEDLELVGAFRDSIEALSFLAENDVDVAFLDINMPRLDGMRVAGLIRDRETDVIFCTAYSEYAVESYEKGALDYLLKPISYERFLAAVEKARRARTERSDPNRIDGLQKDGSGRKIFVKSGPRIHRLDIDELLYMEKKDHYVVFHSPEGEVLSRMNMIDLLESLPAGGFARVHRSYVVAIDKIDTIDRDHILIKGVRIPIGDTYRDEFFKRIRFSGG